MVIICHYGEIALKGGNRRIFEEKLVDNIKKSLKARGVLFDYIKRISGRIIIKLSNFDNKNCEMIVVALKNVFGIVYFCFAEKTIIDVNNLSEKAVNMLIEREFTTFRISASRSDKNLHLTSQAVNEQVGAYVLEKLRKKVRLDDPDITLFIELVENQAFLYTQKIAGLGGLPTGVNGRAVCLISGGIDSPAAAWLAMKRGLAVIFLHLHTAGLTNSQSIEKVKRLAGVLAQYQPNSKMYFLDFGSIQKAIFNKAIPEMGCILCKRMMIRLAEAICQKEKAQAIITGDSLGQVASQTIENMAVISQATTFPILRPLICYDKQEAITLAQKIGTYEISIEPHLMYCSQCLPKHPATKSFLATIQKEEDKIGMENLLDESLKHSLVENIS